MEQDHIHLLKKDYTEESSSWQEALPLSVHAFELPQVHNQNMTESKDTLLFSSAINTFYKIL